MESGQIFFLSFSVFNLCLVLFCQPLSKIILAFFALIRKIIPIETMEQQASQTGFGGSLSDKELISPSQKQAAQLLIWSGSINFIGSIAFYLMIHFGIFGEPYNQSDNSQSKQHTSEADLKSKH